MAIPTYDQLIEPLLRFLGGKPRGVSTSEVYAALADSVGLTDDEREQLLPSRRQPVYQNRIGWAHDRLKRAGLSQSRERGTWQLTDAGRVFLAKHPNAIDEEEIEKIAEVPRHLALALALLVALSFHFTLGAAFAAAQDLTMAPAQELGQREREQAFERKQRRLNIAGWTLVGAGAAFPVIAVPISAARGNWGEDNCLFVCPDVVAAVWGLVLGPVMVVTGGALLWQRRSLQKSHEVNLSLGPGSLMIHGEF
jgi:hypothetical protein